jgi:putative ATP-dependent endonuclease of OLD family
VKIKRFAVKNVTSYKERTEFVFDERINILIGPNGGGKSNLQKILALVLSKYFIHQYEFKYSDQEAKIEPIDLWTRRVLERNLARFIGDDSDQEIEIELAPESSDVENIKAIGNNLDKFNEHLSFWESPYPSYEPLNHAETIATSVSFTYRITNFNFQEPEPNTAAWGFKEYLRTFFIFMRLASRLPDVKLTSPVFFFFSERTSNRRVEIQSNQITEQSYFTGFRSAYQAAMGENTDLLQWGAQHFARLYWKAVHNAASKLDTIAPDLFKLEPDVKLLSHYMQQLGYEWGFLTDQDAVSYAFALRRNKDDPWLTADKFSSGEREIVHFLLAMFALNVKDGVILVDEPELHLHPRWQRIFLGLFRDLAPERNNQFVISTHSPVFVTPDTVNNITRVYKSAILGSAKIALQDIQLPQKKNLVRMINSQNNERVFFADKVVLVEGITDRLVLASLLDAACARFSNNQAIEIVEVGGKTNFDDYRSLLEALMTPSVVVADLDYLTLVGSEDVRALFVTNTEKQWESLKDKKSTDAMAMMAALKQAIDKTNTAELQNFWAYFVSRHPRLKEQLSGSEQRTLDLELARLRLQNVLVLRHGEIEDYLPPGVSGVKGIVDLTTDRNWINRIPDESRRVELGQSICQILDVSKEQSKKLEEELRHQSVAFPQPVSERLDKRSRRIFQSIPHGGGPP